MKRKSVPAFCIVFSAVLIMQFQFILPFFYRYLVLFSKIFSISVDAEVNFLDVYVFVNFFYNGILQIVHLVPTTLYMFTLKPPNIGGSMPPPYHVSCYQSFYFVLFTKFLLLMRIFLLHSMSKEIFPIFFFLLFSKRIKQL